MTEDPFYWTAAEARAIAMRYHGIMELEESKKELLRVLGDIGAASQLGNFNVTTGVSYGWTIYKLRELGFHCVNFEFERNIPTPGMWGVYWARPRE
jgi:hypothetical protein